MRFKISIGFVVFGEMVEATVVGVGSIPAVLRGRAARGSGRASTDRSALTADRRW